MVFGEIKLREIIACFDVGWNDRVERENFMM